MNLLLFDASHRRPDGGLRLVGEAALHVHKILKSRPGDTLEVGELDGRLGRAEIEAVDRNELLLAEPALDRSPPPPLPVALWLALPRPKFLGRILQDTTSLGVKEIHLIHTARVQKSYWTSSGLAASSVDRFLRLGLQQGRDTVRPRLELWRNWREVLTALRDRPGRVLHLADGDAAEPLGFERGPADLVIGPEGGLLASEVDDLKALDPRLGHLGPRTLRVETAVTASLSRAAAAAYSG